MRGIDLRAGGGGGVSASPFIQTLLDDTDATTARNTLEIAEIDRDPVNRLVSGGQVVWESGYTFRVSAATYYVNGALFTSAEQTIALNAADGTNPRIDILYLDDTGTVGKKTGVASATPSEPDIDPTQQIKLTFVFVEAASSAPAGLSNEDVYLENTEWTATVSGTGYNAASTSNPYAGTTCIEVTDTTADSYVKLVRASAASFNPDNVFVFFVRSKAAWGRNRAVRIQWFHNGVTVGSAVTLADGYWGFDSSVTGAYRLVAIPCSQFGIAADTLIDEVRFTTARGTMGFHLDNIRLQVAADSVGQQQDNYLTKEQADAAYLKRSTVKTVTTTTYTILESDLFAYLRFTNVAGCAITVPPDILKAGDVINMRSATAGTCSLVAGSGVTLNKVGGSGGSLDFAEEGATVQVMRVASNAWDVIGGMAQ